MLRRAALALILVGFAACRTGSNYADLAGPRYAGGAATHTSGPNAGPRLRVATFNIAFARRVDRAIAVIESDPFLRQADVVLLQEMDEPGTRRVADALGMAYVYYPGTWHLRTHRDFGNAVLSRWPLVDDAKILLPHLGLVGRLQRTATAATLRVAGSLVRVYSAHLSTMVGATAAGRRAQLGVILADAEPYEHVVIGGDMNSHGVGRLCRERGYLWPTEHGPRTTRFGRWDHIFFKGLASSGAESAGTVLDVRGASDHRAVWADAALAE